MAEYPVKQARIGPFPLKMEKNTRKKKMMKDAFLSVELIYTS